MSTFQCPGCGYRYDEALGKPHEGLAPGTALADVPCELSCPDCGVRDFIDFERLHDAESTTRVDGASVWHDGESSPRARLHHEFRQVTRVNPSTA